MYVFREDSYIVLNYEHGYRKIFVVTLLVLLCSHWFDLYDTARLNTRGELYFRLLMVPGLLAFCWPAFPPSGRTSSGQRIVGDRPADPDGRAVWMAHRFYLADPAADPD
jgi:hypothetical protein